MKVLEEELTIVEANGVQNDSCVSNVVSRYGQAKRTLASTQKACSIGTLSLRSLANGDQIGIRCESATTYSKIQLINN